MYWEEKNHSYEQVASSYMISRVDLKVLPTQEHTGKTTNNKKITFFWTYHLSLCGD